MAETRIEWATYTWNPWFGCQEVSPACDRCYAATWGRRSGLMPVWGAPRVRTSQQTRRAPLRWNDLPQHGGARPRVFCLSLGDFFDNQVPTLWRDEAWEMIHRCTRLDWLLLTKRPQNIHKMLPPDWGNGWPNVWLGATTENPQELRRLRHLLNVPARIHWVSAEPLLEGLDLRPYLARPGTNGVNWVVGGGETGGKERPSDPAWFRSLRDQCQAAGAAYFMKQMTKKAAIPTDLLVREHPA